MSDKETRSYRLIVRIRPALQQAIKDQAERDGVTPSVVVRRVLADHFTKR